MLSAKVRARLTVRDRQFWVCRVPPDKTKLTISFNACRRAYAEEFIRHSLIRAQAEAAEAKQHGTELFFCDYLGL
jgi:hypothetical protein